MTDAQLQEAGAAILAKFDDYSRSDPFGWDWPTMAGVFPDDVTAFRALQQEWRRRHPTSA